MFKILIADDDYEDRELLKLEIQRALASERADLRFYEASSIGQARRMLTAQIFDLLTLDIAFDRLNEGIESLPDLFETYPTLNIIVISGKLNKGEVLEQLFHFTKNNVLKEKRWARHFDVLDKKDDKSDALRNAYSFALKQKEIAGRLRELFLLAESYLEKNMVDKCLEVYQKIQDIAPGEIESSENIRIFSNSITPLHARDYYRKGDAIIAALLLGHSLETRLKKFTEIILGHSFPVLSDCLKALERAGGISSYRKGIFSQLLRLRNKAIHQPSAVWEQDFDDAAENLQSLEDSLL
jgi:CheY-like chemotaxis protein